MKYQRGVALSGLIFWGVVITLVAVLGMKVVPTTVEYYKILKDIKATVNKVGPEATINSTSSRNNSMFPRSGARSWFHLITTSAFRSSAMSAW